jgi:hypothetical protein
MRQATKGQSIFSILDYAIGDGQTLDTVAIQSAWQ